METPNSNQERERNLQQSGEISNTKKAVIAGGSLITVGGLSAGSVLLNDAEELPQVIEQLPEVDNSINIAETNLVTEDLTIPVIEETQVENSTQISFNEAFKSARSEKGSDATFEWNGNVYSTNIKSEVSDNSQSITISGNSSVSIEESSDAANSIEANQSINRSSGTITSSTQSSPSSTDAVPDLFGSSSIEETIAEKGAPDLFEGNAAPDLFGNTGVPDLFGNSTNNRSFGALDTNNDGKMDTYVIDKNKDGKVDVMGVDENYDGKIDSILINQDGDLDLDIQVQDTNHNGVDRLDVQEQVQMEIDMKDYNTVDSDDTFDFDSMEITF